MSGRTIILRLTVAEADHLLHLVLEDHKEHATGREYLARLAKLRRKLLSARNPKAEHS